MNTYIVTANYRFDVIHYLVKAESEKEAEKIVEDQFDGFDSEECEDLEYVKKHIPQILDISIESDEKDYGCRYFDSHGCIYGFSIHAYLDFDNDVFYKLSKCEEFKNKISSLSDGRKTLVFVNDTEFDTKEECDKVADKIMSILGPTYEKKWEKGRAYGYYIGKKVAGR